MALSRSKKTDFSRKLPKPIDRFRTLADVRNYIVDMKEATPQMIYIGELTLAAAQGGPMDKLVTALEMMRTNGAFK